MAFACCPHCGHVVWELGAPVSYGARAGNCPECSWMTYWTASPLGEMALRRREELRGALTVKQRNSDRRGELSAGGASSPASTAP